LRVHESPTKSCLQAAPNAELRPHSTTVVQRSRKAKVRVRFSMGALVRRAPSTAMVQADSGLPRTQRSHSMRCGSLRRMRRQEGPTCSRPGPGYSEPPGRARIGQERAEASASEQRRWWASKLVALRGALAPLAWTQTCGAVYQAAFDYWLGCHSFKVEERDRYPHAAPSIGS
jgi:hypothetical protein